jgi:hypothetical protein
MTGVTEATATLGNGTAEGAFSFNKVEFIGLFSLINNPAEFTFDTLIYGRASRNRIQAGKILNINEHLLASGTPCGKMQILSTNEAIPAIINSPYCNQININFAQVTGVFADPLGICAGEDGVFNIYGDPAEQINIGTNWTIHEISEKMASLLGNDTLIDCRTTLPFIQTSEGFGAGELYTWFYKATATDDWIVYHIDTVSYLRVNYTGYYSLSVSYGNNCYLGDTLAVVRFIEIDQELPPTFITTYPEETTIVSCANPVLTLIVNQIEDDGTYTYLWKNNLDVVLGVGQYLSVSDSGTYTVIVTGPNYCVDSMSISITKERPLAIGTVAVVEEPNCSSTGSIQFYVTGGSGAYEYSIDGGATFTLYTTGLITGLTAGSYRIMVIDANHTTCPASESAEIILHNSNNGLLVETAVYSHASNCEDATDGILLVSATGGQPPYSYTLNGAPVAVTNGQITGLGVGVYVVGVSDSGTPVCVASSSETRISSAILTLAVEILDTVHTTCGVDTGAITFVVTGSNSYRYQLNNTAVIGPITTNNPIELTELNAGVHTLRVFDECGEVTETFTIENENTTFSFSVIAENGKIFCDGVSTEGKIILLVTGNEQPYRYTTNGTDWIPLTYIMFDTLTVATGS